jgi:hypothetical protein
VVGEAEDELVQVGAREAPVEGFGDLVVVALELVQGAGEVSEVVEVVGCEQFALDDREGDLDLVEPTGVQRQVDEGEVSPAARWSRSIDFWPRCQEPLSTIQKTRRAEA